jgi:hypothetical protein
VKLDSPRTQSRLLWVAAVVLAAGIAAIVIAFWRNTGTPEKQTFSNKPVQVVKKQKTVKLEPEVRVVAGQFILTAVQRKDLPKAWTIVGPGIRQDLTYKEWLSGNIPVVPFLQKIKLAPMKVDISSKGYALLEVYLLPKAGRGQIFSIELIKQKGHWVVNSWAPRSAPTIPNNPSSS